MSDEHVDLARQLAEAGYGVLAAELELKRLGEGLAAAGRQDLATALTAPEPQPEAEPEPPSEAELVARELGKLNQGWLRVKA